MAIRSHTTARRSTLLIFYMMFDWNYGDIKTMDDAAFYSAVGPSPTESDPIDPVPAIGGPNRQDCPIGLRSTKRHSVYQVARFLMMRRHFKTTIFVI